MSSAGEEGKTDEGGRASVRAVCCFDMLASYVHVHLPLRHDAYIGVLDQEFDPE